MDQPTRVAAGRMGLRRRLRSGEGQAAVRLAGVVVIMVIVIVAPLLLAPQPQKIRRASARPFRSTVRGAPDAPPPVVGPIAFKPIPAMTAVQLNALVPFSTSRNPPARPFVTHRTPEDTARAVDCLAAAEYYEAGDDPQGERAVAQVVLNRVRHPSFPKTVCGVIFQGSERTTGCQFTFTCDGSLGRYHPTAVAWGRAQAIAVRSLNGNVYAPVGYATHYHTDWVVPYWSSSLMKVAAVGTQIFFRWPGWWGTSGAFSDPVDPVEPVEPALADLSVAHRPTQTDPVAAETSPDAVPAVAATPRASADPNKNLPFSPTAENPNVFLVTLPADVDPERYPDIAAQACGARPRCVFMGWNSADRIPMSLPASTSQLETIKFHFIRDPVLVTPRSRWNCALVRLADTRRCLSHQIDLPQ
ncbi:cell wall hydrolase [Sphingomonas koreensis]|nr:cell wall hydrolase [Sphingomonas koreensis]